MPNLGLYVVIALFWLRWVLLGTSFGLMIAACLFVIRAARWQEVSEPALSHRVLYEAFRGFAAGLLSLWIMLLLVIFSALIFPISTLTP